MGKITVAFTWSFWSYLKFKMQSHFHFPFLLGGFVYYFVLWFLSVVMASGNLSADSYGPEVSANRLTANSVSEYPSRHCDVQEGESHRHSTLNLSVDSGTSSAELSQLHSDTESRLVLLIFFTWHHWRLKMNWFWGKRELDRLQD